LRLIRYEVHPVNMPIQKIGKLKKRKGLTASQPVVRLWSSFASGLSRVAACGLVLLFGLTLGRAGANGQVNAVPEAFGPLPQDMGTVGLKLMLRRLSTTARLMQTVAHPDDEDGGMLTLESRGKGDTVLLMTLNRGEGGQNKLGSNLFDGLGVLRTLELLAADRYYGAEQRFSRVADFGYSKTADETFQKWGGHDVALADMVRVIRTFRPDVLVARFSGTDRDGHGNHQASAILTQEAFHAAADPNRFPEQIKEGLLPWQPKKLYIGNVCSFGAQTCADANYTLRLNTGMNDPLLGSSAIQFAMDGLRHQLSQGAGAWTVEPGDRFTFYKLTDSVLSKPNGDAHEKDFLDGIDTSLVGLADRLGGDEAKLPDFRAQMAKVQSQIAEARKAADSDPNAAAKPLLEALLTVDGLVVKIAQERSLNAVVQKELLVQLRTKQEQLQEAANLALGVVLSARVDTGVAANPDDAFMAVPGQGFTVTVSLRNSGRTEISARQVELNVPEGWRAVMTSAKVASFQPGAEATAQFRVTVAENAEYSRPYWHRRDPETEGVNTIDEEKYATLPFPPPPVRAFVGYSADGLPGGIRAIATVAFKDSEGHEKRRALAVGPAFSVEVKPSSQVIPLGRDGSRPIDATVKSFYPGVARGRLQLSLPTGWRIEPDAQRLEFVKVNESQNSEFHVFPGTETKQEGRDEVKASLAALGKSYAEGFNVVTRDDLDTFYYYQPAVQRESLVDVKVPAGLKVGYIMGAGDDIPTVLEQIGMDVTLIPAEKLATENLTKYGTVVLGIRAYDTQRDVVMNNQRLLDYVSAGGTLVVQYDTAVSQFNERKLAPYPAQLSRARVSVEDAPVEILAPENKVFHSPNEISQRDFSGWVQERGLYFMGSWDSQFTPLLASHDPGEASQNGGLLMAKFGKGTYIYTGYAFFRQLPAGVPGAVRLYVNLLAAGH
jgi:LmbE family N-acetylglucosaminyl deacetylase